MAASGGEPTRLPKSMSIEPYVRVYLEASSTAPQPRHVANSSSARLNRTQEANTYFLGCYDLIRCVRIIIYGARIIRLPLNLVA